MTGFAEVKSRSSRLSSFLKRFLVWSLSFFDLVCNNIFLDLYGLIKIDFKSLSKITRKHVILDVYDGSQGRHPKRDLKPCFISPYPCKNPILTLIIITFFVSISLFGLYYVNLGEKF